MNYYSTEARKHANNQINKATYIIYAKSSNYFESVALSSVKVYYEDLNIYDRFL